MPFLKKTVTSQATLGFWEITETWMELLSAVRLSGNDELRLQQCKTGHRKAEFLAVRALLQTLTGEPAEIHYLSDGRPFLKGIRKQISISHSRNLAAVILSDLPSGIDVEDSERSVAKIVPRFLSDAEQQWTLSAPNPHLAQLFCWCAKEAVFKLVRDTGIEFSQDIAIPPFNFQETGAAAALFCKNTPPQKIPLSYTMVQNNMVVWCVEINK